MSQRFMKDPDAVLDYHIDWSKWLDGDTISASTWDAPTGITIDSSDFTSTTAVVWLSEGTEGSTYKVVNSITTSDGRSDDRTLFINVRER